MNDPITLRRLALAAHVRACESDGQAILLDLRGNRYLGISRPVSAALASFIDGWPVIHPMTEPAQMTQEVEESLQRLTTQGLLTELPGVERFAPPIIEATASVAVDASTRRAEVDSRAIVAFIKGAALAAWWLRCRSLNAIATAVVQRRQRDARTGANSIAALTSCAATYHSLRPFAVTAREKCLYDSLVFLNFLASQGLFPHWVIGVKTSPFGAHSWVQSGNIVLNDQHEYVRRFRPLLVA
ncbi:lasso peptide biosynthesis B2 protein [Roseateles sp. NT4]|uniref:lasso peptide biosynthesis B2 protein n=1 Tax=Roseateles sp. NT4 TaxID=3453715 RepID=UPI003EED5C31